LRFFFHRHRQRKLRAALLEIRKLFFHRLRLLLGIGQLHANHFKLGGLLG
jgi:hypothetical protein